MLDKLKIDNFGGMFGQETARILTVNVLSYHCTTKLLRQNFFFPKVNSLSRKGRQRALPYVERDSTSRSHSSIIVRIARFAFVTSVSKRVTLITPK